MRPKNTYEMKCFYNKVLRTLSISYGVIDHIDKIKLKWTKSNFIELDYTLQI